MKIYLLRHGQTLYNEQKRYQGQQDIPLSEKRTCGAAAGGFFSPGKFMFAPFPSGGNRTDSLRMHVLFRWKRCGKCVSGF